MFVKAALRGKKKKPRSSTLWIEFKDFSRAHLTRFPFVFVLPMPCATTRSIQNCDSQQDWDNFFCLKYVYLQRGGPLAEVFLHTKPCQTMVPPFSRRARQILPETFSVSRPPQPVHQRLTNAAATLGHFLCTWQNCCNLRTTTSQCNTTR